MWPFSKREERSIENPSVPLTDATAFYAAFGSWGGPSSSGLKVNPDVAMSVPAVSCGVDFISSTVAALSLDLYKREGDSRDLDEANPLYAIVHDVVNDDLLTSYKWRKEAMHNTLLKGRSYTFVELNKAGRVMNLWPLDPDYTTPERVGGRTRYKFAPPNAQPVYYESSEVIDIPWQMRGDGISHYVPWDLFKDTIGLAKAIENFGAKFFESGGVPPLALQGPLPSAAGAKRAANDIDQSIRDANAERRNVLVLPAGHELKEIGFDPSKGQMTDAQRFQIEQVARWFKLPPTFLQDLTRATFSNSEQQDIHLVKHTLRHWLDLWEDELNAKLFARRNRRNFVYFNDDELMRGDFLSRMQGYGQAIQNGIYTPNEAREKENYPKHKNPDADELLVQGATVVLGQQVTQQSPAPDTQGDTNVGA